MVKLTKVPRKCPGCGSRAKLSTTAQKTKVIVQCSCGFQGAAPAGSLTSPLLHDTIGTTASSLVH